MTGLIAVAFAAPHVEDEVAIEKALDEVDVAKAQMPWFPMGMNPMGMNPMGMNPMGMNPWQMMPNMYGPQMGSESNEEEYPIDYSKKALHILY